MRCGFSELLVLIVTILLIGFNGYSSADCGNGMGGGGQSGIGEYKLCEGWISRIEKTKTYYSYGDICSDICKRLTGCIWRVIGSGFSIDQHGNLYVDEKACGTFTIMASCDEDQTYKTGSLGSWSFFCSSDSPWGSCKLTKSEHIVDYGDIRTITTEQCHLNPTGDLIGSCCGSIEGINKCYSAEDSGYSCDLESCSHKNHKNMPLTVKRWNIRTCP